MNTYEKYKENIEKRKFKNRSRTRCEKLKHLLFIKSTYPSKTEINVKRESL